MDKPLEVQRLVGTRIVALPQALDTVAPADDVVALRFAPDELFITAELNDVRVTKILSADPHAILVKDAGFSGLWMEETRALKLLERLAAWEMPSERPAFAQGAVAGIATKLWFDGARVLLVVPTPYAHELRERFA